MKLNDTSLVEQARTLLEEECEDFFDGESSSAGYRSMIADSLLKLESANQLKRIADALTGINSHLRSRR